MTQKVIKVLIVEDSPVRRKLLEHILKSDKNIEIIGYAKSSSEALNFIKKNTPDVITMDIHIQGEKNGFELSKSILKEKSIPIIIISAIRHIRNTDQIKHAMMNSGALYFIDAPPGPWSSNFSKASEYIINTIKTASQNEDLISNEKLYIPPPVLSKICKGLPKDFKYPIIIAQHISPGFDKLLVDHINLESKLNVKIAENKEIVKKGTIYFVPAGKISEFLKDRIMISNPPKNYKSHLPSISMLFASAISYYGNKTIAMILTGMGKDGVKELKILREEGAITITQDETSSRDCKIIN